MALHAALGLLMHRLVQVQCEPACSQDEHCASLVQSAMRRDRSPLRLKEVDEESESQGVATKGFSVSSNFTVNLTDSGLPGREPQGDAAIHQGVQTPEKGDSTLSLLSREQVLSLTRDYARNSTQRSSADPDARAANSSMLQKENASQEHQGNKSNSLHVGDNATMRPPSLPNTELRDRHTDNDTAETLNLKLPDVSDRGKANLMGSPTAGRDEEGVQRSLAQGGKTAENSSLLLQEYSSWNSPGANFVMSLLGARNPGNSRNEDTMFGASASNFLVIVGVSSIAIVMFVIGFVLCIWVPKSQGAEDIPANEYQRRRGGYPPM